MAHSRRRRKKRAANKHRLMLKNEALLRGPGDYIADVHWWGDASTRWSVKGVLVPLQEGVPPTSGFRLTKDP